MELEHIDHDDENEETPRENLNDLQRAEAQLRELDRAVRELRRRLPDDGAGR